MKKCYLCDCLEDYGLKYYDKFICESCLLEIARTVYGRLNRNFIIDEVSYEQ